MPEDQNQTTNPQHSTQEPQHDYLWHALDATGKTLFEAQSPQFGRRTTETRNTHLQDEPCIRFGRDRRVAAWLPRDGSGALLRMPVSVLTPENSMTWPRTGDIHVRADVALEHAVIVPS
jgi:hypothetical protein